MFLFYMINHADRANIGVVLPYIKKDFLLTNLQAGALASFFFLGYTVSQVPAGFFMSKVGPRVMTSLSLFAFSIFTFFIGWSRSASIMRWFRLGLGIGEGPAGIGAGALLKTWFPHKEQATATGIYMAASTMAMILVPPVCVAIMLHWGWRMVFYSFAVPGIIVSTFWYIFVRNRPEQSSFCNAGEREYILQSSPEAHPEKSSQAGSLGWLDVFIRVRRGMKAISANNDIFKSWNIWADCIVFFFIAMCQTGWMVWLPSYLVNERHYSMIRMGLLAALPSCGSFIGFIGGGWASDRLWRGRRKPMMFSTAIAAVIMLYLLANAPASPTILAILLFINGLTMSSSMPVYISYPMGLTDRKTYPTALGMVSTAGSLGGFCSPVIAGFLLDTFKTYNVVFYFFAFAVAMTFVFAATMVEPLQTIGTETE